MIVELGPWLPSLTWMDFFAHRQRRHSELRRVYLRVGAPDPGAYQPTERELRWRSEDEWLLKQWELCLHETENFVSHNGRL